MALRCELVHDPKRGPGHGLLKVTPLAPAPSELKFSLMRNQGGDRYLGPEGRWQGTLYEHRASAQASEGGVSVTLGPWFVDAIIEQSPAVLYQLSVTASTGKEAGSLRVDRQRLLGSKAESKTPHKSLTAPPRGDACRTRDPHRTTAEAIPEGVNPALAPPAPDASTAAGIQAWLKRRKKGMPRVFLNYRHEDSAAIAGRLFDCLCVKLGRERVFRDVDTLAPGADFAKVIADQVASCHALIAVIGKDWLTVRDGDGYRRLDHPGDLVKAEIREALARDKLVIPALVGGTSIPKATELPPDIAALAGRQAIEISDSRFDYDTDRLIRAVQAHTNVEKPWRKLSVYAGLVALLLALGEGSWRWWGRTPTSPKSCTGIKAKDCLALALKALDAKELEPARQLLQQAAKLGATEASLHLAEMYDPKTWSSDRSPVEKADWETAGYWYEEAARGGEARGMIGAGRLYCQFASDPVFVESGLEWLRKAATAPDADAEVKELLTACEGKSR
jgi:hypothetical protein